MHIIIALRLMYYKVTPLGYNSRKRRAQKRTQNAQKSSAQQNKHCLEALMCTNTRNPQLREICWPLLKCLMHLSLIKLGNILSVT